MLRTRIVTAAVLAAALCVVVLWLPPVATIVALTLAVLAGAWEWSGFLRTSSWSVRIGYVVGIAVLLPVVWHLTAGSAGRAIVLAVALLWWIVALLWVIFAPRRAAAWSAALAGLLALLPAWVALMRLRLDLPVVLHRKKPGRVVERKVELFPVVNLQEQHVMAARSQHF